MLTDIYSQLLIMSAVAGVLYLLLKLANKLTKKYFTATWHYYSHLLMYSLLFDSVLSEQAGDNQK
ncbi:hypothetical protein B0H94_103252 [Salsuginibacillus halophilus]|uniref:Uncharacterized protein n=1 Tax=Salsuginibacillus halophilus TaxID=517424 RepID=A0A2P8HWQ3_9BACI|nr:hypothetical protein B0H94_103252 [Salsuginibacillus halophilus]